MNEKLNYYAFIGKENKCEIVNLLSNKNFEQQKKKPRTVLVYRYETGHLMTIRSKRLFCTVI